MTHRLTPAAPKTQKQTGGTDASAGACECYAKELHIRNCLGTGATTPLAAGPLHPPNALRLDWHSRMTGCRRSPAGRCAPVCG